MQPQEIQALIEAAIADSKVEVSIEGSHVNVVVVSSAFEGMRPVQKQQLVYKALAEQIASGVIHAVNMQTLTPAEAG
ncbi:BolA/IbaG family iron-sulfur metabolism protein [Simiduia aestuariiviva]|uniref:Acid stress-induced BolA-like protein IbaG/YrbA n=1 Tax=Simiduia aestuariiviva TaxID=1510459 RepID=A0A839UUI0_9GAMM|nr:BolA/IbaG family iron-sulfur metabolism protein [Simiduia aestuariiviva]MBB3169148.1 acid stress-induced BolA-like protein IbaG/YrbA [Simiduia aestuariiviva]